MMPFTIDDLNPAEERLAWDLDLKNTARAASNALPRQNASASKPSSCPVRGTLSLEITTNISHASEGRDETAAPAEQQQPRLK